jgi:hypothetical protein
LEHRSIPGTSDARVCGLSPVQQQETSIRDRFWKQFAQEKSRNCRKAGLLEARSFGGRRAIGRHVAAEPSLGVLLPARSSLKPNNAKGLPLGELASCCYCQRRPLGHPQRGYRGRRAPVLSTFWMWLLVCFKSRERRRWRRSRVVDFRREHDRGRKIFGEEKVV